MNKWYDIIHIAETLGLSSEEDAVIWKFDSILYVVVNL
jgi:hypothetical protein